MNRNKTMQSVAIFFCFIFTLTACTASTENNSNNEQNSVAMGRYTEEELPLPPEINTIRAAHQDKSGMITLLAGDAVSASSGSDRWKFYRTADRGESWTSCPEDGLVALNSMAVTSADFDLEGNLYASGIDPWFTDGIPEESEFFLYGPDSADMVFSARIPVPLPLALRVADNGELFICPNLYTIEQYTADGLFLRSYSPGESLNPIHAYLIVGDELVVFMGNRLNFYDTDSGSLLRQVDIPAVGDEESLDLPLRTLWYTAEEDAFYLCNSSGLFRYAASGKLVEHLAESDLTSFGVPTLRQEGLLVLDDSILVWFSGNRSCTMLRYSWDAQIPTVPSQSLHVYSLYDCPTIRQANMEFQRGNPDVLVNYEIGMHRGFPTVQDAISNLNTRMLADDGPDVLVLDDLPINAFVEQGALVNLSGLLDEDYMEPIISAYRQADGSVYAIPARFGVPVLLGGDDAVDSIRDLSGMAGWAVEQMASVDDPDVRALRYTQPEALVREWFPLCFPTWSRSDGSLDRAQVLEFLRCIEALHGTRPEQNEYYSEMNPFFGRWRSTEGWWVEDIDLLSTGTLLSPDAMVGLYCGIEAKGEGAVIPLPTQSDNNLYIPVTVLATASTCDVTGLATEYIRFVLSEPVQRCDLGDGFPVNVAAFQAVTSPSFWSEREGNGYLGTLRNGTSVTVPWPSVEGLQKFRTLVDTLDTPAYTGDTAIQEIVLSAANAYFSNTLTLEQAVDEIAAKLELYRLE